ncbi:MAG: thiamine pyrophosphate-binding protein [Alphaproteobacteria bacterium]|nr:thiamine pyrophosphate-binding protein [Alphaproteobacteria bacterium]
MNGGEIIVRCLEEQGVDRVFCVPGESFLPVLDGLQQCRIETVLARHEGGASMMAEADGKMTGRPGIVIVTRGPGATNASSGIHVAQQDSTPLIMLVGQVARDMRGRDAFQEVDFEKMFGDMAKHVAEINDVKELPQKLSDAFRIAMEGRPGPVVLSLPEDMLYDTAVVSIPDKIEIQPPPLDENDLDQVDAMIRKAAKPFIIAGGSSWNVDDIADLSRLAKLYGVPVACSFRRQRLMDSRDPFYAGDLGLGCNPALLERIKNADLLLMLGGRLSEIPSQSYSLLSMPKPQMPLIHLHSDANELGRVYTPELALHGRPGNFLAGMLTRAQDLPPRSGCDEHLSYQAWTETIPSPPGEVNMAEIMVWLRENLPDGAIMTNGAGNYATWLHRFYHFRDFMSQLAPTSGSMGYGIPAALAASLQYPGRQVICFAGDGDMLMSLAELASIRQSGARVLILILNNASYGTIRMHQETHFPARKSATDLINPDFAAVARACGLFGEQVASTDDFPAAFQRLQASETGGVLELAIATEAIAPLKTLSNLGNKGIKGKAR